MIYLLDVNALLALGLFEHEFHHRVSAWVRRQRERSLATCSITELGFVRILTHAPAYGLTIAEAQGLLLRMKRKDVKFSFISDDHDASRLPAWVKTAKQVTDGHLSQLAVSNGAVLATLDEKIPGAFLIPQ